MNHPSRTCARILSGALFAAALACGSSALASPKEACSLVPLSQVQSLIGADGAIMSRPSGSKDGVTSSFCTYGSKAYVASLVYMTFASADQAHSAYAKLSARPGMRGRGYNAIKGAAIVMAYVNDNSAAHAEQKTFSQQLGTAMLNAI
jgi:hypothetical protein